jgi:hypothetical protein
VRRARCKTNRSRFVAIRATDMTAADAQWVGQAARAHSRARYRAGRLQLEVVPTLAIVSHCATSSRPLLSLPRDLDPAHRPGRSRCQVFLCHNSLDKPVIKELADRLQLDFGVAHFPDAFAIPTGEAFRPWIAQALRESSGCTIFLGAHGWGPTHLWEAEQ